MVNLNKEEVSVFENLNCRNKVLLDRLYELERKLHNSNYKLGGSYALKEYEKHSYKDEKNHIDVYDNILYDMEEKLFYISTHIERLECLIG